MNGAVCGTYAAVPTLPPPALAITIFRVRIGNVFLRNGCRRSRTVFVMLCVPRKATMIAAVDSFPSPPNCSP